MPLDIPLRFVPYLRPMVWGGRRLEKVLHKQLPTQEAYGESWEVSDHPLHRSVVAEGPGRGSTLRQIMERDRSPLLGRSAGPHATFPWLVKFLDACDWLSVQVHPDTEVVQRLWPGEGSKTEAWFVLDAQPGSRIYAGLLPGVNEARLRAALKSGTVADCLHQFEPRPGDCVFLSAGTVHAVGGGVLIAEVQQTSDATFRLFDWNRVDGQGKSRQLHIEEAIASIDWHRGPVEPVRCSAVGRRQERSGDAKGEPQTLVRCPFFQLDYLRCDSVFTWRGDNRLGLLIVLQGQGCLRTPNGEYEFVAGQAWVLPAALSAMTCKPSGNADLLLCTLP
jgi:mannose-6-phosphate isomerase